MQQLNKLEVDSQMFMYIYIFIFYIHISIIKSKGHFLLSTWQGETYPCTKSPFLSRLDKSGPKSVVRQLPTNTQPLLWHFSNQTQWPISEPIKLTSERGSFTCFRIFPCLLGDFLIFHMLSLEQGMTARPPRLLWRSGFRWQPSTWQTSQRAEVRCGFLLGQSFGKNSFSVKYCK